jgi:transposase-like protein
MNIKQIHKNYNTQQKCLSLLEKIRWGKTVTCPYCGSNKVYDYKNAEHQHKCYNCNKSFSVLVGTIFQNTKLPLPDWFLCASLILHAKSGMSASEISRHLELPLKTAWLTSMKIRCAMIDKKTQLHGVLEADESYFTSAHRLEKGTSKSTPILSKVVQKRGRGTGKIPVVGITEKGGRVRTKVIEKLLYYKPTKDTKEVVYG